VKGKTLESTIDTLKPPVFWKDKPNIVKQSNKWKNKEINKILEKTFHLETQLKANSILGKKVLVKKLLIDICNLANT
jgi:DNA polymerase III delta subunit